MEFLVPWHSIEDEPIQAAGMTNELRRELSAGHPLYGLPMRAIGRRQDCDDVLYVIEDGSERLAVVHLTWTQSAPDTPPFPWTVLHASFEAWQAEGMRLDHDDFCGDSDRNFDKGS